jgi:hypothetical protein
LKAAAAMLKKVGGDADKTVNPSGVKPRVPEFAAGSAGTSAESRK